MGLGQSKYAVLCILVPCWSMYVSTWEEYHTGTLYLGFINGPVEGVLIAVGILTVSALKGEFFVDFRPLPDADIALLLPLSVRLSFFPSCRNHSSFRNAPLALPCVAPSLLLRPPFSLFGILAG